MSSAPLQISVSEKYRERIASRLGDDTRIVPLPPEGGFGAEHRDSRVLLHWGIPLERFQQCPPHFPSVEWVHTFWAGTERILPVVERFRSPSGTAPLFTDSRGLYSIPIGEHVLGLILGLTRGLHRLRDLQARRRWVPVTTGEVHGKSALVLGAGGIGQRVGELLMAFGVDVEGIRRRPRGDEPFPVHDVGRLDEALPRADILVCALPETPETIGLLDRRRLESLRSGAIVVNVGRGSLLDQDALVELLERSRLAGAALDVFAEEPLPEDSPLWSARDLWVSPHCSGLSPEMVARRVEFFVRNLEAFRRGRSLEGLVPRPASPS